MQEANFAALPQNSPFTELCGIFGKSRRFPPTGNPRKLLKTTLIFILSHI
jgi:hypothetical protein